MRVLILGASGMVGHCLFVLMKKRGIDTYGTVRKKEKISSSFLDKYNSHLFEFNINIHNWSTLKDIVKEIKPSFIINTIGITKHRVQDSIENFILVNSTFPFFLTSVFDYIRILHISTDCVFDGKKGNYTEKDPPNFTDIYSTTKALGEPNKPNCLTIRTSVIGHELQTKYNLLEWFLNNPDNSTIKGYSKVIFSGLCVPELENVISNIILPREDLTGLYHISSDPIDKYTLLTHIKKVYNKNITIEKDESIAINRSLNSEKFRNLTNYIPPSWEGMIKNLYIYYKNNIELYKK